MPAGFPGQPVEDSGAILREERFERVAALAVPEPEAQRPGSPAQVGSRHDYPAASCGEESVRPVRCRYSAGQVGSFHFGGCGGR